MLRTGLLTPIRYQQQWTKATLIQPQLLLRLYANKATAAGGHNTADKKPRKSSSMEKLMSWRSIATAFVVCGSFLAGVLFYKRYRVEELKKQIPTSKVIGKAALGGPWNLVDFNGNERKSSDFHGQFVLLYFGFTNCPDVCPVEVEKMCAVVDKVEHFRQSGPDSSTNKLYKLTPLMISVDPERDTPAVLKRYCSDFSPKLIGLTGTPAQVDGVTRAFRIYHAQSNMTQTSNDRDYLVDHTIVTYLIGPSGEFIDYYGQYKPYEDVAASIVLHMLNERKKLQQQQQQQQN